MLNKSVFDRVSYYRTIIMFQIIQAGKETTTPEILKGCKAAMKWLRAKYARGIDQYMDDWEWGYLKGKFAALRWVLGMEWDFLDT